jgi:hypothetical protein
MAEAETGKVSGFQRRCHFAGERVYEANFRIRVVLPNLPHNAF